ncbi:MAG: hypothetical protein GY757_11425 [bacterium]|nr:hypothetical protein [bacterium]
MLKRLDSKEFAGQMFHPLHLKYKLQTQTEKKKRPHLWKPVGIGVPEVDTENNVPGLLIK